MEKNFRRILNPVLVFLCFSFGGCAARICGPNAPQLEGVGVASLPEMKAAFDIVTTGGEPKREIDRISKEIDKLLRTSQVPDPKLLADYLCAITNNDVGLSSDHKFKPEHEKRISDIIDLCNGICRRIITSADAEDGAQMFDEQAVGELRINPDRQIGPWIKQYNIAFGAAESMKEMRFYNFVDLESGQYKKYRSLFDQIYAANRSLSEYVERAFQSALDSTSGNQNFDKKITLCKEMAHWLRDNKLVSVRYPDEPWVDEIRAINIRLRHMEEDGSNQGGTKKAPRHSSRKDALEIK